jgi:hypothetical protein
MAPGGCSAPLLAGSPAIVLKPFVVHLSLQTNEVIPSLGHDGFLTYPFHLYYG